VGLSLVLVRPFLTTALTEPLALIVTFAAVPILCWALRRPKPFAIFLFTATVTLALMVRMGNLFLLPGLILWAILTAEAPNRRRIAFAAFSGVAIFILANEVFAYFYAPPGAMTGNNFAMTLCGLSVGSDWSECFYRRYATQLAAFGSDEKSAALFLLRESFTNILANPGVFALSLVRNIGQYLRYLNSFHMLGRLPPPSQLGGLDVAFSKVSFLILLVLATKSAFFRSGRREQLFWAMFFLTTISAVALIMSDDGWRVLVVTHVMTAAFLAMGLRQSRKDAQIIPTWTVWPAIAGLATVILALLVGPLIDGRLERTVLATLPAPQPNEVIIAGDRFPTGFIVRENRSSSSAVTVTSVADLRALFQKTFPTPEYDNSLEAIVESAPIALIYAPLRKAGAELIGKAGYGYFILPEQVLLRRDVRGWRLSDVEVIGSAFPLLRPRSVTPLP
jgi:hypothetical protein